MPLTVTKSQNIQDERSIMHLFPGCTLPTRAFSVPTLADPIPPEEDPKVPQGPPLDPNPKPVTEPEM
jgi:hypothetical protein